MKIKLTIQMTNFSVLLNIFTTYEIKIYLYKTLKLNYLA